MFTFEYNLYIDHLINNCKILKSLNKYIIILYISDNYLNKVK